MKPSPEAQELPEIGPTSCTGVPPGRARMEPWCSNMAKRVMESLPAFVLWCDEYSVRNELLDQQHQGLLSLINELYASILRGEAASLPRTLEKLEAYTRTHFLTEERLLRECGYELYEDHKKAHDWMIQKTISLRLGIRVGDNGASKEMFSLLKDWWIGHICRTDRQYASCLARAD
jgi:hemerythrin-like metal-binding protein